MKYLRKNCILFLTACVDPKGMGQTMLQDKVVRLQQYIEAIRFYLSNTSYPILVVENTNYDFSEHFKDELSKGRIECLTFDGNNFDKSLGKGYGEGLIINYAFKHSKILCNYNYIIKISGRHKLLNLHSIVCASELFLSKNNNNIVINELNPTRRFARSDMFIASKSFYQNYLNREVTRCNDSDNVWFENVLYDCTLQSIRNGFEYLYIPFALDQRGCSGTGGTAFPKTRFRQKLHFFLNMILYKLGLRSI